MRIFTLRCSKSTTKINRVGTSFKDAVCGINNLGKLRQMIEIRPVITKANYRYLYDFAVFIVRNFPYVSHVAFMGQEIVGCARNNYDEIWVDPTDYIENLHQAVEYLDQMRICVSIYNIPLCLLPKIFIDSQHVRFQTGSRVIPQSVPAASYAMNAVEFSLRVVNTFLGEFLR